MLCRPHESPVANTSRLVSTTTTKAGIVATLNARTSILASANPVESRYNAQMSVVENIKLPPTLLSRFDLIFLILDKPCAESDRRLARHLVSLYHDDASQADAQRRRAGNVDQAFLRDFIAYARNSVAPEITDDAVEGLVQGYLAMRHMSKVRFLIRSPSSMSSPFASL